MRSHWTMLGCLTFVTAIASSVNLLASLCTIRLLIIFDDDEQFSTKTAVYTKYAVIFYAKGVFIAHFIREAMVPFKSIDSCIYTSLWLNLLDFTCWISLYTQPLACISTMMYGHYSQKLWIEQMQVRSQHRNTSVAPERAPVVVGQPVYETMSRLEQMILQYINESIPTHEPSQIHRASPFSVRM